MGTQVGPPHQVQQHELQALNPLLELGQTFRKYGNRGGSHLGRQDILARLRRLTRRWSTRATTEAIVAQLEKEGDLRSKAIEQRLIAA
jgi:hypothetical protein